jgi:hypothetical protein
MFTLSTVFSNERLFTESDRTLKIIGGSIKVDDHAVVRIDNLVHPPFE